MRSQTSLFDDESDPASPICHHLSETEQGDLLDDIVAALSRSPFYRPTLPRWGTPFSVLMSNCGTLGWVSDKSGYRYQRNHPETGDPWAPIPEKLMQLWADLTDYAAPPEACLINYYQANAKMGLHQDKDEKDFSAPVLSISLGDDAHFRLGGLKKQSPTKAFALTSGDVMQLAGATRLAFHGVDRVYPNTNNLLARYPSLFPDGGRLNLTLRRVNPLS